MMGVHRSLQIVISGWFTTTKVGGRTGIQDILVWDGPHLFESLFGQTDWR